MGWEVKYKEEPDTQYPPENLRPKKVEGPLTGNKVTVITERIQGCCPVSVEGDKWVFDPMLHLDDSKISSELLGFYTEEGKRKICPIALKSVYPYMHSMCEGVKAVDLGIAKSGEDGYVICPAWGPPTCEAIVVYRLHPEPLKQEGVGAFYENLARQGYWSVPSYYLEKFASEETKDMRKKKIEEWKKAGKPKWWEGWRNPPCQPRHGEEK